VNFDLVIFDCDGVLVDSEAISCRAHAEVLSRHGYPITQEQVFDRSSAAPHARRISKSRPNSAALCPTIFMCQLQDEQFRSFEADLQAVPHIHAALDAIVQPVCVAVERVATAHAPHPRPHPSLRSIAPNIFSSSQVINGKPAPDLFLFAAGPDERCTGALHRGRGQRRRHLRALSPRE
jgi:beta-phosphoglucomutase-like phosphatase (HAD superfamily)